MDTAKSDVEPGNSAELEETLTGAPTDKADSILDEPGNSDEGAASSNKDDVPQEGVSSAANFALEGDGEVKEQDAGGDQTLKLWVGTWNLAAKPPPDNLHLWIQSTDCDMYVIGTQETSYVAREKYKTKTMYGAMQEAIGNYMDFGQDGSENIPNVLDWIDTLRTHFGDKDFRLVAHQSLWAIRVAVFVRLDKAELVRNVDKSSFACGMGSMLGNKGAVAVSLKYGETVLGFVNCHLAAHQDMTAKRNDDYKEVVANLHLGTQGMDILNQFHHTFMLGDFNYRVNFGPLAETPARTPERPIFDAMMDCITTRKFGPLLRADSLHEEQREGRAFQGFEEGDIDFPPTYKIEVGEMLSYTPKRAPAWCDRILWRSLPHVKTSRAVVQHSYKCSLAMLTSDHKPVFSEFSVPYVLPDRPPLFSNVRCENFGIRIRRLSATGLVPWDETRLDSCDAYVKVVANPFVEMPVDTKYCPRSVNPSWPDGLFVRLSRTVRCHKTLGNAFLSFSVLDSDVLPPHTVLGRAVVELAVLGPIYLSQPLEILDNADPKLTDYVPFEVPITLYGQPRGTLFGELCVESILRHDPPPDVQSVAAADSLLAGAARYTGSVSKSIGLAFAKRAKNLPNLASRMFSSVKPPLKSGDKSSSSSFSTPEKRSSNAEYSSSYSGRQLSSSSSPNSNSSPDSQLVRSSQPGAQNSDSTSGIYKFLAEGEREAPPDSSQRNTGTASETSEREQASAPEDLSASKLLGADPELEPPESTTPHVAHPHGAP